MNSNNRQSNQLPSLAESGAVKQLGVTLHGRRVGTLAQTPDGLAAFEYDSQWLSDGFSISPLSLPLRSGVSCPICIRLMECSVFSGIAFPMDGALCC